MVGAVVLGLIAVTAIVATVWETARDGYRRIPTRPELLNR